MFKKARYLILIILSALIIAARINQNIGEWYANTIYPHISSILSFSVSWIPFSMEEVLVVGISLVIIFLIIKGIRQKKVKTILCIGEIIIWIIVWAYLGWGMNYFRANIYTRAEIQRQNYEEKTFKQFINDYADNLNQAYTSLPQNERNDEYEIDIKERYSQVPEQYGLCKPKSWQNPKTLLFNSLYSAVGVGGYIGPFFCEIQLNEDLLPDQKPFSYAHELSHLLGVSNEDEANFWAYQICRNSKIPQVRYSGYLSLLPYVLSNASSVLSKEKYNEYLKSIKPEIRKQFIDQQEHWDSLYNELLGKIQHSLYNSMLKGNKISSGTKNYMQVIDMIIALEY